MPTPPSAERWYNVRRVTLPASGEVPVRYEFQPDQILLIAETALVNGVDVLLSGAQGGAPIPLYGQGPIILPGLANPQMMTLRNLDTQARTLRIVAQKGYPPSQIVAPVTLAALQTAEIQSQTNYENPANNEPSPQSFLHYHPGGSVVVFVGNGLHTGAGEANITGVTIGGVAAVPLGNIHTLPLNPNNGQIASWWWLASVPSGNIAIATTLAAATGDHFYAKAFSFQAGIRMGNLTTYAYVGGVPLAFNVVGQAPASLILMGFSGYESAAGSIVTEVSGAAVFDPIHNINADNLGRVGMYSRTGTGIQTFDLDTSAITFYVACVALEILPQ